MGKQRVVSAKEFGRRLASARESAGYSQSEFAKKLNLVGQSNLSRWERGQSEPGILSGSRIVLELGLTPNQVVLAFPVLEKVEGLTGEELEILRLIREMQAAVPKHREGSPLQVILNLCRNSHKMITGVVHPEK